jgi:23S rRNA (cytosine1962-C5)-methyltransferase
MSKLNILITNSSKDYELLDSGDGEKLERFGSVVLSRPDPQALWRKRLDQSDWKKADAIFSRAEQGASWSFKKENTKSWDINFSELKFRIKPTAFKHTGLFPEQAMNWGWMRDLIEKKCEYSATASESSLSTGHATKRDLLSLRGRGDIDVLNLFGYTGGASLACAQAGARVVHVDGSKSAVSWARENAELSGLAEKPIRWILEDARVFVGREIKRGNKYDAIIMDPPAFGHGANKEIWKIEENFLPLVEDCINLLKDAPLFFIINGYSAGYSAIAYENVLKALVEKFGGSIEIGELAIEESKSGDVDGRLLPCGIYARWAR